VYVLGARVAAGRHRNRYSSDMRNRGQLFFFVALASLAGACAIPSGDGDDRPPCAGKCDGTGDGAMALDWSTPQSAACAPSELGWAVFDAIEGLPAGRNVVPSQLHLTTRNLAGPPLVGSGEIFPGLAALVAEARYEVALQFHQLEVDTDGFRALVAALVRAQARLADEGRRGDPLVVRVLTNRHVLFDSDADRKKAKEIYAAFAAPALDPRLVRVELAVWGYHVTRVMHGKAAVIDGALVHVGSANMNPNNDYVGVAPKNTESAFVLAGEIAQAVLATIDHTWDLAERYSCDTASGSARCARVDRGVTHRPEVPAPELARYAPVAADACLPMMALTPRATENPFTNDIDHPLGRGYVAAIDAARERIEFVTPNLNDDAILDALERAIRRGVHVRGVLGLGRNDYWIKLPTAGGSNVSAIRRLQERFSPGIVAGADPLLDLRWYSLDGVRPHRGSFGGGGGVHDKVLFIDGQLALVGSTNLDTKSFNTNHEISVAIDHAEVTARYAQGTFVPYFGRGVRTGWLR
jgi:phosphatidylserine/phosphatidylglycerophosphate/cardiolipin synthase-like enzyme